MYSIKKNCISTIEIQKSKFICKLVRLTSIEDVENEIKIVKKEYKGANHYCYAYIFGNLKKFSDDGEPSGTAGLPILNVIESKKINNVLAIVIRYFGGIKLGAGGLVRAYTNSVTSTLNESNITELVKGKMIKVILEYDLEKTFISLVPNIEIIEKTYLEKISYLINISNDDLLKINSISIDYEILKDNILIEK